MVRDSDKQKDKPSRSKQTKSKPHSKGESRASKNGARPQPLSKMVNQTTTAPATFADDRTMTSQMIRTDNAVQKVEYAKNMAKAQARLAVGNIIRTTDHHYEVVGEVEQGVFGFKYEVEQSDISRKRYFLRTEPLTRNDNMMKFKTLKYDLMILKLEQDLRKKATNRNSEHIPKFHDVGATADFKFVISQALGLTLYDITRKEMKSAFSPSTALRVSIQMLRAIRDLHSLGFLHRQLKPEAFAIGRGHHIRTIFFNDFGEPFSYRESQTKRIKRPRKQVRIIGILRYMSRNSQLNKEHGRRDDLEAWAYLSIEFFDLKVLPWRNDQVNSAVLDKKQKLIDGNYPTVFMEISLRFQQILRYISNMKYSEKPDYGHIEKILYDVRIEKDIDFDLPYDWEGLSMRPTFGRDPKDAFGRVLRQDPIRVSSKRKKKKPLASTITPGTLPEEDKIEGSEISSRSDATPKTPVGKTYMDKIIDVHMTGDGVNENEKFYKEGETRAPKKSETPKGSAKPSPRVIQNHYHKLDIPERELSETDDGPEQEHSN